MTCKEYLNELYPSFLKGKTVTDQSAMDKFPPKNETRWLGKSKKGPGVKDIYKTSTTR